MSPFQEEFEPAVKAFLNSAQTTHVAKEGALTYLRARVDVDTTSEATLYTDVEERIALVKQMEERIHAFADSFHGCPEPKLEQMRTFRFNLIQLSAFLCIDIVELRRVLANVTFTVEDFYLRIKSIESLVRSGKFFDYWSMRHFYLYSHFFSHLRAVGYASLQSSQWLIL